MFVFIKIWDCHGNRLRAGLAVCIPLTEDWTSNSLTGRCGRIFTLSDENQRTSGVRSPDEHSNNSRTTSCRSGSSCAVWVSSGGTGFPTIEATTCEKHALPGSALPPPRCGRLTGVPGPRCRPRSRPPPTVIGSRLSHGRPRCLAKVRTRRLPSLRGARAARVPSSCATTAAAIVGSWYQPNERQTKRTKNKR